MATKLPIERYTGPLLSPLIRFEYQSSPTHTSSHRHFPNVSCCSSLLLSVCLCSLSKITNIATTNLHRLENILKIECSDLSSGVYSCLCVRACVCASKQLFPTLPSWDWGGVNVACQGTGVMEERMSDHLISFWWWVVVNGGVCVCESVSGGRWGMQDTSPTSTTRAVECVEGILCCSWRAWALPARSLICLDLKFLHLRVTDDINVPSLHNIYVSPLSMEGHREAAWSVHQLDLKAGLKR